MMLEEADLLQALRRHWEYSGKDEDIAHEIYHDDAVLEFPQSGERFEGVENFREWRRRYPAKLTFHTRRITVRSDMAVVENLISYDGAPWMFTVSLLEFRGDRVVHERIYVMDGWDAAEWRAPWRSEVPADPPSPAPYQSPASRTANLSTATVSNPAHTGDLSSGLVWIAQLLHGSARCWIRNLSRVNTGRE